jgi:hypothetical protein
MSPVIVTAKNVCAAIKKQTNKQNKTKQTNQPYFS